MTDPAQTADYVPWFSSKDWPLHQGDGWPPLYPFETTSESGLTMEVDRDRDHEACWEHDLLRDRFCIMPKGHDTPHMPMSRELAQEIGPLIVRRIGAYIDGRDGASS